MSSMIRVAALALLLSGCAGAIVVPEEHPPLAPEQIRAALLSEDFRAKNHAREQLGKLAVADQVKLLNDVLAAGDAATRTLAVVELAKIGTPEALDGVQRAAASDPDVDVKEMAALLLGMGEEPEPGEEDPPTEE